MIKANKNIIMYIFYQFISSFTYPNNLFHLFSSLASYLYISTYSFSYSFSYFYSFSYSYYFDYPYSYSILIAYYYSLFITFPFLFTKDIFELFTINDVEIDTRMSNNIHVRLFLGDVYVVSQVETKLNMLAI